MNRAERELTVLREVAGAVNASLDLPVVLQRILEAMAEAFGFRHSMVLLPVEGGAFEVRASLGFPDRGVGARVGPGDGMIGVVVRRRKLLRMGGMRNKVRYLNMATDGPAVPRLPDAESVIIVPLLAGEELVGVLSVESHEFLAFDEDDERLVATVSNLAAAAIRNARLYHDLVEMHRSGERFVPHEFVRFLDKRTLKDLGRGESTSRDMTVMFSDLRSFTAMSERLAPSETFELLNRYFATMVPPIQAHRGFVDKFIGDAIMALFDETTADGAVHAAIAEHRALDRLNTDVAEDDVAGDRVAQPLSMGIGLHTGPVTLGVVGSEERLSCTVYGDTVNLASRVESLTQAYGARLLITGSTRAALAEPERLALRLADRVRVKGKSEVVELWEVLDALPEGSRADRAPADALDAARATLDAGRFTEAAAAWSEVSARWPRDPLPAYLADRARALAAAPPPDWDGARRLDQKG